MELQRVLGRYRIDWLGGKVSGVYVMKRIVFFTGCILSFCLLFTSCAELLNGVWSDKNGSSTGSSSSGGSTTTTTTTTSPTSGSCGENLSWTLDTNGTLTISGTGPMSYSGASPISYISSGFNGDVPWYYIRDDIKTVDIKNGVTSVGNGAFCNCTLLTNITIPSSVTSIGAAAFTYCTLLTSIKIPASVTSMGINPFVECSHMTRIDIAAENTNYCFSDNCLFSKNKTKLICYLCGSGPQEYSIPSSVTSIEDSAFTLCTSLTSITIPSSVISIGGAFYGCFSLKSIKIPSSVTSIGSYAFERCTSLTSIKIPSSVTSMGSGVFSHYCSNLQTINVQGFTSAPSGWDSKWNSDCSAKVNWGVQ